MIPGQLKNIFKGIGGEFEINRVVGAFGALTYIVGAHGFLIYRIWWMGKDFDLDSYCLSFPTGLGIAVGSIAGAVALKDRQVASAKVIETTASKPATPPQPAPQVQPELSERTDAAPSPDAGLPESLR